LETGLVPAMCIGGRFVLAYAGAGVIDEAYSDIFAESLGFFYQGQDVSADYELGGDSKFGAIRSMSAPRSVRNGLLPDHYRDRFEFALTLSEFFWDYSGFMFVDGQYFGNTKGRFNYGGNHWNSGILSHVFYLAVEGGTHGSSGVTVDGVGGSNRAEIERIFFRAMRDLMPPMATLPLGAAVIRQSAADLAPGSAAERAIDQALRAVGLPPGLSERLRPPWE
ncbi:MAG: M4 family metallopeptidase, partial [Acidobacteriota bacterium]|nr:M4 family metallopeptidase [Acidobacteriota bacterium]